MKKNSKEIPMIRRGRKVPSRVTDAEVLKISTQFFDYQLKVIQELSKNRATPIADLIRFAIDFWIVSFKKQIKKYGITIPPELEKFKEEDMKKLV